MTQAPGLACSHRILVSVRGPWAIAYCVGNLDRSAVEDLSDRVLGLASLGVRGFVCSLERIQQVHFQAMEPLLALQQSMQAQGAELVLAGAGPYVKQILDFGGVPRRVSMAVDKHEALGQLMQAVGDPQAQGSLF